MLLEETKKGIAQEKEITRYLEERKELSKNIGEISPILEKYIEKHYPIEEL